MRSAIKRSSSHDGRIGKRTVRIAGDRQNCGGCSDLESTEDFRANGLTLTLGGLPGQAIRDASLLSAADYKGRAARFIFAFMDSSFQEVKYVHERFYFVDTVDYVVDPERGAAVSVALETEVRRATRTSVRRYTDQDQRTDYPDDRTFEFTPYLNSGIDVRWGTGGAFFK